MKYRRLVVSAAAAATLATGSLALATLSPLPGAVGQDEPSAEPAPGAERQADRPEARRRCHRRPGARATIRVAAEAIGVTPEALVQELRDGKSITEVAEANGVDPATVEDALLEAAQARIDKVLTAKRER
jgi:hypothetical protein